MWKWRERNLYVYGWGAAGAPGRGSNTGISVEEEQWWKVEGGGWRVGEDMGTRRGAWGRWGDRPGHPPRSTGAGDSTSTGGDKTRARAPTPQPTAQCTVHTSKGAAGRGETDASRRGGAGAADGGALGREAPLALPVLEAADEARVGLDAGALAPDEVEGGVVGHVVGVYEVRDHDRGRTRHALKKAKTKEEEGGEARRVRDAF